VLTCSAPIGEEEVAPVVETIGTGKLVPKGPEGGSTAEVEDINEDPAAETTVFLQ